MFHPTRTRLAALLLLLPFAAHAARPDKAGSPLPATPPLGWSSYDSYGLSITAEEWKRNVDWLHEHLQTAGWRYVIIDGGWYDEHPENGHDRGSQKGAQMDAFGQFTPAPNRFPHGLAGPAAYAHSLGLLFGIHIVRGLPRAAVDGNLPIADSAFHAAEAGEKADTCSGNTDTYGVKDSPAGQAYYDSLVKLYAGWGVDFLEVDCIASPFDAHEIHMIDAAIAKAGRPMVLSLAPGPTPLADGADVEKSAQMWRISDDLWDIWSDPAIQGTFPQTVRNQFGLLANWMQFQQVGHWPDADILPIGYLGPRPGWGQPRVSRLNYDETRTALTLWSIARAPLILGANLPELDSFTEALLTNREVLAVDQSSSGNRELLVDGGLVVWRADAPKEKGKGKGVDYAVFNLGNTPSSFAFSWKQLGVHGGEHRVRDLWQSQEIGRVRELAGTLPMHGAALFRVE